MTSASRDEVRLGGTDRAAMRWRVVSVANQWQRNGYTQWDAADAATILERVAYHAIGCGEHDMRDTEIAETRAMVADVLASFGEAEGS